MQLEELVVPLTLDPSEFSDGLAEARKGALEFISDFGSDMNSLGRDLGKLGRAAETIGKLNEMFPNASPGLQTFIGLIGTAGEKIAILGPIVAAVGTLLSSTFGLVGVAFALTVAHIVNGIESLKLFFGTLVAAIKGDWDEVDRLTGGLYTKLKEWWEKIKNSIGNAAAGIKAFFTNMFADIKVPAWLQKFLPGSPSPFELSVRGIDRAVRDLDLQARLAGPDAGAAAVGFEGDAELRRQVRELPEAIAVSMRRALRSYPAR